MPSAQLKSFAKKSGKSMSDLERYWDEAKKEALKKFGKKNDSFWKYVVGIVERRAGLRKVHEDISFATFLDLERGKQLNEGRGTLYVEIEPYNGAFGNKDEKKTMVGFNVKYSVDPGDGWIQDERSNSASRRYEPDSVDIEDAVTAEEVNLYNNDGEVIGTLPAGTSFTDLPEWSDKVDMGQIEDAVNKDVDSGSDDDDYEPDYD